MYIPLNDIFIDILFLYTPSKPRSRPDSWSSHAEQRASEQSALSQAVAAGDGGRGGGGGALRFRHLHSECALEISIKGALPWPGRQMS
jgi:hypothetical protein